LSAWRVVKETGGILHHTLKELGSTEYPYTICSVIRRRQQIDNYNELPKEKRPPRAIWDSPSELNEWFDRVYSGGSKQTEFTFNVDDIEE
jgi:hypothetical protein